MAAPKIIVADNVYIPKSIVDMDEIRRGYEKHLYHESKCARCDNAPLKFNDICATCPGHIGFFKTWKSEVIDEKRYIGLPKGNFDMIKRYTGVDLNDPDVEFTDLRSDVRAKHPLNFTPFKLFTGKEVINGAKMADQLSAVKQWNKVRNGLLLSVPRSGKTVMGVRLICVVKRRVLFFAHEGELLKQGLRTLRDFTDLRAPEAKIGKKLAGIIQNDDDWKEGWDTVFVTYQKLISALGNKRIRKYVLKQFGFLIVDEVHRGNADAYISILRRMDMRFNLGLTATDKRKDGKQFLIRQVIGKIVAKTDAEGLVPKVYVHDTNLTPDKVWTGQTAYTKYCSWQAEHKERNRMLIKQVFRDLRENKKNCIVIPVLRVAQAQLLVKLINKQAIYNNETKGEKWSEKLAITYIGASDKKKVMAAAREGTKTRVTIAIRQKIQDGIDVIPWTHEYLTFPVNNATNFYQMTQRICTPAEGKPDPVLRIYMDNFGLSIGCFAATWFNGVIALKYRIPPEEYEKAKLMLEKKEKSNAYSSAPKSKGRTKADGPSLRSMWSG
jgi:superfamily II DNA or RNA helicase